MRNIIYLIFCLILALGISSVTVNAQETAEMTKFCIDNGGHTVEKGDERGYPIILCVFPNGKSCEVNDFFNEECSSSSEEAPLNNEEEAPLDNPSVEEIQINE